MTVDENTRLVQSAHEAFGRGDTAALAELMADDVEWVDPGALPTASRCSDLEQIATE